MEALIDLIGRRRRKCAVDVRCVRCDGEGPRGVAEENRVAVVQGG